MSDPYNIETISTDTSSEVRSPVVGVDSLEQDQHRLFRKLKKLFVSVVVTGVAAAFTAFYTLFSKSLRK